MYVLYSQALSGVWNNSPYKLVPRPFTCVVELNFPHPLSCMNGSYGPMGFSEELLDKINGLKPNNSNNPPPDPTRSQRHIEFAYGSKPLFIYQYLVGNS